MSAGVIRLMIWLVVGLLLALACDARYWELGEYVALLSVAGMMGSVCESVYSNRSAIAEHIVRPRLFLSDPPRRQLAVRFSLWFAGGSVVGNLLFWNFPHLDHLLASPSSKPIGIVMILSVGLFLGIEQCKGKLYLSTEECILSLAERLAGEQPGLEKMAKMEYAKYLQTPYWLVMRAAVLYRERHNLWCHMCRSIDRLVVHHTRYDIMAKEYEKDNVGALAVVCDGCHNKFHGDRPTWTKKGGWKSRTAGAGAAGSVDQQPKQGPAPGSI